MADNSAKEMNGFWDSAFIEHSSMWGFDPANSAVKARDLFVERKVNDILIPGFGYGRNAKIFIDNGIKVTGIEISETAIRLAEKQFGTTLKIFHGSVTDMPFDDHRYDGIFCYGLLYLLNTDQRKKFIKDCFSQLDAGGWMVFTVISKKSPNYGKGVQVAKDTFELGRGGQLFFYDENAVEKEFQSYGLHEITEIDERAGKTGDSPAFKFFWVSCQKQ